MKKLAGLFLVLGVLVPAFAEDMAPLAMPSTRSLGMGGTHVAYTDDVYALFVNPAALQNANQGSVVDVAPGVVGPFFDLLDLATSSGDDLIGALGDFAAKTKGKIPLGVDLRFPLSAGYTGNGLGFGLWNRFNLDLRVIGTDIDAAALADVIMNFGMSFNILNMGNHVVDAGFVVKPFLRAKGDMNMTALDAIGGDSDLFDKFNVPLIAGAGLDLGFMYRFFKDLAVGITIDDVYTGGGRVATLFGDDDGVSAYRVPITLNMGAAYTLQPLPWLSLAFMLDYRDVINLFSAGNYTKKNPILNLALGTEIGILQFFKLRFGLNEMLPAVGIGLEAKAFQFNVAIYGKELGLEPGGFSTYGLDVSIAIRPQTKQRNRPWGRPILNSILDKKAGGKVPDEPDNASPTEFPPDTAEAAAAASLEALDAALTEPDLTEE
jgi:hypothetical protein